MTEHMDEDFIPYDDAQEVMEFVTDSLARIEAWAAEVRKAVNSVNGWLGPHDMTYAELRTLKRIDHFLSKVEAPMEDAASLAPDMIR
jgi:hypothetical protein